MMSVILEPPPYYWSPLQAPNLLFWYATRRMSGFADGDPVGSFPDQSGNGRNLSAAGAARPTWKANQLRGRDALRFDGATSVMTGPALGPIAQPYTHFVVVTNMVSTNDYQVLLDMPDRLGFYTVGANRNYWLGGNAGDQFVGSLAAATPAVIVYQYNGASSIVRANGVSTTVNGGTGNINATIQMGKWRSGNLWLKADVCEVFSYSRALSLAEIQRAERGLKKIYSMAF